MPIYERHQIGGLQTQQAAQPLKLQGEDGAEVLMRFNTPERAKDFVWEFPGHGGGLVVEFGWILERLGSGYGISLSPGHPVGIDFDARDLCQSANMRRPN